MISVVKLRSSGIYIEKCPEVLESYTDTLLLQEKLSFVVSEALDQHVKLDLGVPELQVLHESYPRVLGAPTEITVQLQHLSTAGPCALCKGAADLNF